MSLRPPSPSPSVSTRLDGWNSGHADTDAAESGGEDNGTDRLPAARIAGVGAAPGASASSANRNGSSGSSKRAATATVAAAPGSTKLHPAPPLPVRPSASLLRPPASPRSAPRSVGAAGSASPASATGNTNIILPGSGTSGGGGGGVSQSSSRSAGQLSTSVTAQAARESNLSSSLTGYLQNQLSLYSKRGHAREVLRILAAREQDIAEAAAAVTTAAMAAEAPAPPSGPQGRSTSQQGQRSQSEDQRLFQLHLQQQRQQQQQQLPGQGRPSTVPNGAAPSGAASQSRRSRAHGRAATQVFAPLPLASSAGAAAAAGTGTAMGAPGRETERDLVESRYYSLRLDQHSSAFGWKGAAAAAAAAAAASSVGAIVPSTGSSNPWLPPLPQARLTLPSEHFAAAVAAAAASAAATAAASPVPGSGSGPPAASPGAGANAAGVQVIMPVDTLTARAAKQYADLAAQAQYMRSREEKEDAYIRATYSYSGHGSGLGSSVSVSGSASARSASDPTGPNTWTVPALSRAPYEDGRDAWGRKLLAGLATDSERALRFAHLAPTAADPVPSAPALRHIVARYRDAGPPRDFRPAIASPSSTAPATAPAPSSAHSNQPLDLQLLRGRKGSWQRMLEQARSGASASSYSSGSQSARSRPSASAPSSLGLSPAHPVHTPVLNPPRARIGSGGVATRSLSYRLNSGTDSGTIEELAAIEARRSSRRGRRSLTQGGSGAAGTSHGPSHAHGQSHQRKALSAPFHAHATNIYSTTGLSAAAWDRIGSPPYDASSLSSAAVPMSFSATGGFQRLQLTTTASLPHFRLLVASGEGEGEEGGGPSSSDIEAQRAHAEAVRKWRLQMQGLEDDQTGDGADTSSDARSGSGGGGGGSSSGMGAGAGGGLGAFEDSLSSLVDFSDRNGSTPLFHSAWENFVPIISLLCAHGARVNVRNLRRHTATDMALERGHLEAVRVLLRYGSDTTRSEARQARARCKARLGATYAAWVTRMQAAGSMRPSGEMLELASVAAAPSSGSTSTSAAATDSESAYFAPLHQAQRALDASILALFAHTVLWSPKEEYFNEDDAATGGGWDATPSQLSQQSQPPSQQGKATASLAHLTREGRLARRAKLRATRAESARQRSKFLVAAGLAPAGPHGPAASAAAAAEEEEAFSLRRSAIPLLARVRAGAECKPSPTTGAPSGPPEDSLSSWKRDIASTRLALQQQERFYATHAPAILGWRARKAEEYTRLEGWIDRLELYLAVQGGNQTEVESILSLHPEHASFVAHGASMLWHAAWHGHYGIVRALLVAGVQARLEHRVARRAQKEEEEARFSSTTAAAAVDPTGTGTPVSSSPSASPSSYSSADAAGAYEFDWDELSDSELELLPDGTTPRPPSERPARFFDPQSGTAAQRCMRQPPFLDVNFLCVDELRCASEEGPADAATRAAMERRAKHRALRRKLFDKKQVKMREMEAQKQKRRELNLSDSDDDDEEEEKEDAESAQPRKGSIAAGGAGVSLTRISPREVEQHALDSAIDSAVAQPLQVQLWHRWAVRPRAWNRALRRREHERIREARLEAAAVAVAAGKASWEAMEEEKVAAQWQMRRLAEEEAADEAEERSSGQGPSSSSSSSGAPSAVRYETAIFAAIKRKHYRAALLLHSFGALSPYTERDLLSLCDVQVRTMKLMRALKASDHAGVSRALHAALAVGGGGTGVLGQVLAFQDCRGNNPVLIAIAQNDLRSMELIKQATVAGQQAAATVGSRAPVAGGGLLNRLLLSLRDRLGHSALDNSLLHSALSSSVTSSGMSASGGSGSMDAVGMTSYLLAQGGLTLPTQAVLDLILQQPLSGEEAPIAAGGSAAATSHYTINHAGVERLKRIIQQSAGGGRDSLTEQLDPASGTVVSPRASLSASSSSTVLPQGERGSGSGGGGGSSGSGASDGGDVIDFPKLYATLDSRALALRPEHVAEVKQLLHSIEDEHAKLRAHRVRLSKRGGGGSNGGSAHASRAPSQHNSPGSGLRHIEHELVRNWDADGAGLSMEVVMEGCESDGGESGPATARWAARNGTDGPSTDRRSSKHASQFSFDAASTLALEGPDDGIGGRSAGTSREPSSIRLFPVGLGVGGGDGEEEELVCEMAELQAALGQMEEEEGRQRDRDRAQKAKVDAFMLAEQAAAGAGAGQGSGRAAAPQGTEASQAADGRVDSDSSDDEKASGSNVRSTATRSSAGGTASASPLSSPSSSRFAASSASASPAASASASDASDSSDDDGGAEPDWTAEIREDSAGTATSTNDASETSASSKRSSLRTDAAPTAPVSASSSASQRAPRARKRSGTTSARNGTRSRRPALSVSTAHPDDDPEASLEARTPPPPPPPEDFLPLEIKARLLWILDDIQSEQVELASEQATPATASAAASSKRKSRHSGSARLALAAAAAAGRTSARGSLVGLVGGGGGSGAGGSPSVVDVTMLKWNNLLRANPHIADLIGVDFPTDKCRPAQQSLARGQDEQDAGASTTQQAMDRSALANSAVPTSTSTAPPEIAASLPAAAAASSAAPAAAVAAAPAYPRHLSRRGSLVRYSAGDESMLILSSATLHPAPPGRAQPPPPRVGARGSATKATVAPAVASSSSVSSVSSGGVSVDAAAESSSPAALTLTVAGWLESFQRLARSAGLGAVRQVIDEFARISAVAKEQIARQRARRAVEEAHMVRLEAQRDAFAAVQSGAVTSAIGAAAAAAVARRAESVAARQSRRRAAHDRDDDDDDDDEEANNSMVSRRLHDGGGDGDAAGHASIFSFLPHLHPHAHTAASVAAPDAEADQLDPAASSAGALLRRNVRWRGAGAGAAASPLAFVNHVES